MEENKYENRNAELLAYLHNNAEMGKDNLLELNGIVKDAAVRNCIEHQILEYKSVYDQTERKLEILGLEPRGDCFAKLMSKMMINAKTLRNQSNERAAEMIIQGSTLGIIILSKSSRSTLTATTILKTSATSCCTSSRKVSTK